MRKFIYSVVGVLAMLTTASRLAESPQAQTAAAPGTGPSTVPFWTGMAAPGAFERAMDARLARARQLLEQISSAKGSPSIDSTFAAI
jgi:hypothetical protein